MDYIRCIKCKGTKKCMSLGFMEEECNGCKGTGFSSTNVIQLSHTINDKPKRGYKQKQTIKDIKASVIQS